MKAIQPNIRSFIIFLNIFFILGVNAQDLEFSQILLSQESINPALIGGNNDVRFGGLSRAQWGNIKNFGIKHKLSITVPVGVDYDAGIPSMVFGGGMIQDRYSFGTLVHNQIYGVGVKNILLNDYDYLSLGLTAGVIVRTLDDNNVAWNSQYDPNTGTVADRDGSINSKLSPDFHFGAMYNKMLGDDDQGRYFTVGASAFHLISPNLATLGGEAKLPMSIKAISTVSLPISTDFYFEPGVLYIMQGVHSQLDAGAQFRIELDPESTYDMEITKVYINTWYRLGDALIFGVRFASKAYEFSFTYDTNNASLSNVIPSNTFELGAFFNIPSKD